VKKKNGRPRTGMLEPAGAWDDGSPRFRGRVRLGDGAKSERFDVPHGLGEKQARAYVASIQVQEDAQGLLLRRKREAARAAAAEEREPHDLETCDAWFGRYLPTKDCGETHRCITSSVWSKWISPVIGAKEMRALTRDDVEDVRDKLDRAIDAKDIRHSTARNAWAALTGALKAAYAARDRSLRVLASPLHFGILPPKRGESRQRPWLYPREWQAFASCGAIPLAFRQTCALALYTGLRPGELRVLTWGDVDRAARTISVSKALDTETGEAKAPKPDVSELEHETIVALEAKNLRVCRRVPHRRDDHLLLLHVTGGLGQLVLAQLVPRNRVWLFVRMPERLGQAPPVLAFMILETTLKPVKLSPHREQLCRRRALPFRRPDRTSRVPPVGVRDLLPRVRLPIKVAVQVVGKDSLRLSN
jgi:integrase